VEAALSGGAEYHGFPGGGLHNGRSGRVLAAAVKLLRDAMFGSDFLV
jgi:hypothetical protein